MHRFSSKDDYSFVALGFVKAGAAVAVVEYDLAPKGKIMIFFLFNSDSNGSPVDDNVIVCTSRVMFLWCSILTVTVEAIITQCCNAVKFLLEWAAGRGSRCVSS